MEDRLRCRLKHIRVGRLHFRRLRGARPNGLLYTLALGCRLPKFIQPLLAVSSRDEDGEAEGQRKTMGSLMLQENLVLLYSMLVHIHIRILSKRSKNPFNCLLCKLPLLLLSRCGEVSNVAQCYTGDGTVFVGLICHLN